MSRELRLAYAKAGATVTCNAYYESGGALVARAGTVTLTEDIAGKVYGGDASGITGLSYGDTLVYYDGGVAVAEEVYLKIAGADNDTLKTLSDQIDGIATAAGQPSID